MRGATFFAITHSEDPPVSIHAPLARGDYSSDWKHFTLCVSIHAPLARGDQLAGGDEFGVGVSIHAPLARGDCYGFYISRSKESFNPRPSCEGRPRCHSQQAWDLTFQSTPLLRGATGTPWDPGISINDVSIHAPLARGDNSYNPNHVAPPVSIHAPLARGDAGAAVMMIAVAMFQSTPLLRGATHRTQTIHVPQQFQSTPLLRGATEQAIQVSSMLGVSIHAPLARGD